MSAVIAGEQFAEEPTALNSNRLPVNAKGEVLFLSVLSINTSGICATPSFINCSSSTEISSSSELFSILSSTAVICLPRNTDIIAGGASFAPKRCALLADIIEAFNNALCLYTARRVFTRIVTNNRFSFALFPGVKRPIPVSVQSDQLLCLPDPLTPANGFSWSKSLKLCLSAILCISDITKRF